MGALQWTGADAEGRSAYRSGVADVPDWFEALNQDFHYQLTCLHGFAPVYIDEEISGNRFKIAGGKRGVNVSWQVTGTRHDAFANAHRIRVEEEKPLAERGRYLYPSEHEKEQSVAASAPLRSSIPR